MIAFGGYDVQNCQSEMNLSMFLYIPFQKKSLLIKEYVLFVPACHLQVMGDN